MGTFGTATVRVSAQLGNAKLICFSCAGSSSYATGGDTLDIDVGTLDGWSGFAEVYNVICSGHGAAADSKYKCTFLPAASGAPGTGKVKINDVTAASGAEVTAATDLSAVTFHFTAIGR